MSFENERRDFLKLLGLGGVVFASGLSGVGRFGSLAEAAQPAAAGQPDFFFLQLSDTHWGFKGPPNPEADSTLRRAVQAVNASPRQPDFIVFTGDLTHTTDDPAVRRTRMREFKEIVAPLKVKTVHFMPGEHDASLDAGEAYKEFFGPTHYSFEHKGVHFVALDNVSDAKAAVGSEQLEWLAADLAKVDRDAPVVVFTHRPLFDLYAQWDWTTADGEKAIALLQQHRHVTVFYGHIHQENHHRTGDIAHHAAKSLVFPLPAPGSVPKRAPIAWDPARPFAGLGYRDISEAKQGMAIELTELGVDGGKV
jgi:3',5'-cyclic AMP phosphodiesterase CpdA